LPQNFKLLYISCALHLPVTITTTTVTTATAAATTTTAAAATTTTAAAATTTTAAAASTDSHLIHVLSFQRIEVVFGLLSPAWHSN